MKERGGLATTIALVIATILGVSYMPRKAADSLNSAESQSSGAGGTHAGTKTPPQRKEAPIASCDQIAKRFWRIYPAGAPVPMPDSCYPSGATPAGKPAAAPSDLYFAVAIVPNPVQTHLPLMFDRSIEAIQQAVEDSGYSYDESWFPWNQSEKDYDTLSDEEQSAQLEAELQQQPGIMVFRRGMNPEKIAETLAQCTNTASGGQIDPNCVYLDRGEFENHFDRQLVVFVVAEQPTGGISDAQFEHALEWMRSIHPGHVEQPLLILGPTFSGTLPSLARQLNSATVKPYVAGVQIYSGTASSESSVQWFQLYLAKLQGELQQDGWKGSLKFRTFFEGDSLMTDRFLCYLQHEGYPLNRVAILSEDETAFGKAESPPAQNSQATSDFLCQDRRAGQREGTPLYLYYPRDIAVMRSAYEKQSIFAAGKAQSSGPSTSLQGDLSESAGNEHDTVRSYGGQLTPLAQEAELFGITNVLDSKKIEYVIVRSSNSLDQLFLSEFLRRSYPGGRVVIDGADLMFRRGMQGASLRGVILLSPYPLLSWTHDLVPPLEGQRSHSYRVFPQDASEGIYIAARELFKSLPGAGSGASVADYAAPKLGSVTGPENDADHRPATWVTVVGHRQFWPLAVLNENTETEHPGRNPFGPKDKSLLEPEAQHGDVPKLQYGLPGEMIALLAFCSLLALWHWYCCSKGSIFRPPRLRAYFAPVPYWQQPTLIFLGSLLLGCLGVTLVYVAGFSVTVLSWPYATGMLSVVVAIVALAFAGCLQNFRLKVVAGDRIHERSVLARLRRWRRVFAVAWLPAVLAFALAHYLFLTAHLTAANRFPTYWRSVFLRSGVSPLLPQVLLILGFYAWFWFSLHGLALFGDDRPVLPWASELPSYATSADYGEGEHQKASRVVQMFRMFSREGSADNIERNALPLGRRYLKSLMVLLPTAVAVLWVALGEPSFSTLGDRRFGTAIFLVVGIYIALILADTLQLVNTWSQLRQLLIYMDRLRLRRTLSTLRGLYGGSVWKLSGNVLEERYRLISRQFESMRNLQNALAAWTTADDAEAKRKQLAVDQMTKCEQSGRDFATWYVDLLNDDEKRPAKEYDISTLSKFQEMLATTAGCVLQQVVMPEWQTDSQSLIRGAGSNDKDAEFEKLVDALPPHVRAAEEFFLLPYMGFIQNTLGRVRTIGISIVVMFFAVTIAVSSYPFDPLPVIGAVFLILFALVGVAVVFAYAEMSRNATLSRIANTTPGELGWDFWVKMIALGAGPLLGLLSTLFPSMTDFIVSFLQPGAQAIK